MKNEVALAPLFIGLEPRLRRAYMWRYVAHSSVRRAYLRTQRVRTIVFRTLDGETWTIRDLVCEYVGRSFEQSRIFHSRHLKL